jgi:hypothetical protein
VETHEILTKIDEIEAIMERAGEADSDSPVNPFVFGRVCQMTHDVLMSHLILEEETINRSMFSMCALIKQLGGNVLLYNDTLQSLGENVYLTQQEVLEGVWLTVVEPDQAGPDEEKPVTSE